VNHGIAYRAFLSTHDGISLSSMWIDLTII